MSKNKSPGYDGIPNEFYQYFWEDVKEMIINSFNEAFEKGELSETHKQIVLSLIFKKGDRDSYKNYRPISLSNVDYKILAFVLSKRLQKVIAKIISPEQVAYIEKRYIGQNIRTLLDIIEYAKKHNKPGILLFLDFEKAFDSINWKFIDKCLIKFGFKEDFCKWIKIIYKDPKAFLKVNGFISESILIGRGIRQGCPLSSLLFIICTEFMALNLKQDNSFDGFPFSTNTDTYEIKITQYADDTCIFLKNQYDIDKALNNINAFSRVSGLTLNISKTEGLCIGQYVDMKPEYKTIKWPEHPIRYLGIYIGNDKEVCEKLNWTNKIDDMQKLIDSWRTRKLTLQGKILIIKSLVIPKITYSASMLSVPNHIIKDINKLMFNFIWGKSEKIQRKILTSSYENGGL